MHFLLFLVKLGSSKVYNKKAASGQRKKTYELDNGLVPLPLRTCFYCRKYLSFYNNIFSLYLLLFYYFYRSCRKAPLVSCDFCSLVFHLDCLDPPLVCMPVGKWMCPNHPQNIVTSYSFSHFLNLALPKVY